MIILTRVDHRLLHGQVAFSWTQSLGADCILIANDDVPTNDIRKTTIKLAKPQGVNQNNRRFYSCVEKRCDR